MANVRDELEKLSNKFVNLVKLGIGEKRKAIELQKINDNIGKYIHFSDSDRAGISFNKNVHPGNPRGFYGFPLTKDKATALASGNREAFDHYGHRKYIYIFDVSGNILDLENFDLEVEFKKLSDLVETSSIKNKDILPKSIKNLIGNRASYKLLSFIASIMHELGRKNDNSTMNYLFRKLGYDAILTNKEGMGDYIDEQIIVLTPTSINILHKLENPLALSKEEIQESDRYVAEVKRKNEEYEKARAKEMEELKVRMKEYEEKEKQRLADRAKYDADVAAQRARYKMNNK